MSFDYFIRDYQQNPPRRISSRMILTEETHYDINQATMEDARAAQEEPFFCQPGNDNEVAVTRFAKPAGWASNTSSEVSRIGGLSGHTIGPNSLVKVMAGDELSAKADYYYPAPITNNSNPLIGDIVTAFIHAITGSPAASGVIHDGTGNISNNLNSSAPFQSIADPHQTGAGNKPRAYLNVLFFNERFEFVEEGSTALRVSQPGDGAAPLVLANIKAPKNGYAFIYLSNETDQPVYFDDFTVSYTRGRIIEENHYYAFGLRISGISSHKFDGGLEGSLKNDYLYQGDFAELDEDIGWHDFKLRNYDAQIGRWVQQDPFQQFAGPYIGMGNDPVNLIDPDGGWGNPVQAFAVNHYLPGMIGAVMGAVFTKGSATDKMRGVAWGFGAGMGASYLNWSGIGRAISNAGQWLGYNVGGLLQGGTDGVIALVGGADLTTNGGISDVTKNIENDLNNFYKKNNLKVKVKSFSSDPVASTMDDVYNYLKKNSKKSKPLFIYGYSLGGHTANQVIKRLNSDDIEVDLFYAVDAALSLFSKGMEISSNVRHVINVYQTDRSTPPAFSRGYPAKPIKGNIKTKITNVNFDNYKSKNGFGAHGAMAEDLRKSVTRTFQNQMKFLIIKK